MINKASRVLCAAALMAMTGVAAADVSDVVLEVHATSARGEGVLEITADQLTWDGDHFFWSTDSPVPIMSANEVLGTFGPARLDLSSYMGFCFQAGDAETSVTITSSMLPLPATPGLAARASVALTLEDFIGTGAAMIGTEPGGYIYRVRFEDGTPFASAIPEIIVTPPDVLGVASDTYPATGYMPIDPAHTGIGTELGFTLTPHALVSGSASLEVIPEPGGLLLIVAGAGLFRRR